MEVRMELIKEILCAFALCLMGAYLIGGIGEVESFFYVIYLSSPIVLFLVGMVIGKEAYYKIKERCYGGEDGDYNKK